MWEWRQKKNKGRKTILAAWGAKNNFHEKLVLCFVHLKSCLLFPGLLHPFASVCVPVCQTISAGLSKVSAAFS